MAKNNLFTRTNPTKRARNYIGTIQATMENMRRLQEFRNTMKELGKLIVLRGRNRDRKLVSRLAGIPYNTAKQDVPQTWATSFDVYWRS